MASSPLREVSHACHPRNTITTLKSPNSEPLQRTQHSQHGDCEGPGPGFMRAGEDPMGSEANRKARNAAWERWNGLLKKI